MSLDEYALQLADEELNNHFDAEAYIVKYIAEKKIGQKEDLVPNSHIDECIDNLLQLFVEYMQNRTPDRYKDLLNQLQQILSELYHTTEDMEQRNEFAKFIDRCTLITQ